jgi:tight adherence protein C
MAEVLGVVVAMVAGAVAVAVLLSVARWAPLHDAASRRLRALGADRPPAVDTAVAVQVAALGVAGLVGVVAATVIGGGVVGLTAGAAAAVAVAAAPEVVVRRRTAQRARSMARDLPRHLDLLSISVEAGMGFDQALDQVAVAVPGELADEFVRMQASVRAGMARRDALRVLAARCPVEAVGSFAVAMVQADTLGVPVGQVLRTQAAELRVRQRQAAQLAAQQAPVRMLVPMVLCIFPALLVVVAGPAVLSIRTVLGS